LADTFAVNTAGSERLRVDSSGNVGIGTGSPTSKLELAANGGSSMITLKRTNASNGGAKGGIRFTENTNGYNVATIACLGDGANTSGALCFYTKASSTETGVYLPTTDERMRITSTGNVGIGTTSPGEKLHIYQSGASSTNLVDKRTSRSTGQYNQHVNYTHYASVAEGPSKDPDNSRGLWVGNMVDENDGSPSGANFMAFTNSFTFYGVDDQTKWDSSLSFVSNTDTLKYSGGDFNKCVRITGDGNVGIGTTGPGYKLDVAGDINISSGSVFRINGTALANSATIAASVTASNSTLVQRHSSGYIFANYFNTTPNDVTSGVTKVCVETGNDGYIRHGTSAAISTFLGLTNSATIEATTADTANKIAQRNSSGDIFARLFRSDYQNQSTISGGIAYRVSTSDNYIRFCTDMGAVRTKIGCAAVAGSTSQNFSSKECYVQNWVRKKGNAGHYWESSSNGNGWHIYPKTRADMYFRTGSGSGGIAGTIGNTTVRGYVHWTTSNEIGFLNKDRAWSLRMDNNKKCHIYGHLQVDGRISQSSFPIASLSDSRDRNITNVVLNSSNFYNKTWVNNGNHFNSSNGRFTCPIDGIYRIYFRCTAGGGSTANNVRLQKNGSTVNESYHGGNVGNHSTSSEAVVSCNANDYLQIQVARLYCSGGTQHKQITFQLVA
jgi:hypothetical protein